MPINDPIQNRKVAPGSLAFERRRLSPLGQVYAIDDPDGDVYNYQYYMDINYRITINNFVNKTFLNTETNKILTSMNNAEERAKHYVSDYKQSFQWDLNDNWSFMTDVYTPVPFNNEFLRTQGIQNESFDYDDTWSFRPTDQNKGVWWVHTYVQIRFSNNSQIDEARLAYFVNGVMFRIIDMVDYHNMGDGAHIRDCRLMGGAHIPLRAGDKLEVKMFANTNVSEMAGVLFPSSIYAYITGHRENCELNVTGNTATAGNGYVFYKGDPA